MTKRKTIALVTTFIIILSMGLVVNKSMDKTRVPILIYHHISKNQEELSPMTITPEKFYEDMLYVKSLGYNSVTFKDLIYAREGKIKLPKNPIVITFDDGYMSNYDYAYPILKKLNMKGVISIIGILVDESSNSNYNFMLNWNTIKEMTCSGVIEIQSHSYDLHNWGDGINTPQGVLKMEGETTKEYENRLKKDTKKLMDKMKKYTGEDLSVYTYPYGAYDHESERILKEMGFKGTLSGKRGVSSIKRDLFDLKRVNMLGGVKSPKLIRKLLITQLKLKEIPYYNIDDSKERIRKLETHLNIH